MISFSKVQQRAKLIYGVSRQDRGRFGGGDWGVAGRRQRGFWASGDILVLHLGSGYMSGFPLG